MIRRCEPADFDTIYDIINDAASVYKGIIPAEYQKEPYMSVEELQHDLDDGVEMYVYEEAGKLVGVMGIQYRHDAALIRHAYVRTGWQKKGIGGKLLSYLRQLTEKPVLIAAWSNDIAAIRFYEKHGFFQLPDEESHRLQKIYWSSPLPKIRASVVLADEKWFNK